MGVACDLKRAARPFICRKDISAFSHVILHNIKKCNNFAGKFI